MMNSNRIKQLGLIIFLNLLSTVVFAQQAYKLHSHNDYEQEFPFWKAYISGAASIEADIFLKKGNLYVAHTEDEIIWENTLQSLYLEPLSKLAKEDGLKELQLLIDLKSEAKPTLDKLVEVLKKYPELIKNNKLVFAVTGNRPAPSAYGNYPGFIQFDHPNVDDLDEVDLSKVSLISQNFKDYSVWNGLGRLTAEDLENVEYVIKKAHKAGKPFRFWGAPDTKTAWSRFIEMGVDFINTDRPVQAAEYLSTLENRVFKLKKPVKVYEPHFSYVGDEKPKNVILMIGDGNGLSQISSAMIANRGELTITQLKNIGLVNSSSYDDLVTDSAAGGTAMATGSKTVNRAIGVDANGNSLKNLTEILSTKGFINGIMTTDEITGATPSAFYAHVAERDDTEAILQDFKAKFH